MRKILSYKKRICVMLFSLIISISLIKMKIENRNIETMAWINENKTIIIDPGHGRPDKRSIKQ